MRLAAPLVLILVLVSPGPPSTAGPETLERGKARFAVVGTIETLDPPRSSSEAARTLVANLFDQLYEYDHVRRPFTLVPALAAALPEVSEDRKSQTIRLRKGVTFVDDGCFPNNKGREVTASDLVYCIKRVMDAQIESPARWMLTNKIVGLDAFAAASAKVPPNPRLQAYTEAAGYPEVEGLEALDEHTLQIHLLAPMPELRWLLASGWFSIYAPEAVRFYGPQLGNRAVGTGPYRLILFLNGKRALLRANPRFRREIYPKSDPDDDVEDAQLDGVPLPLNAVVEVLAYDTPAAAWQAFLNGDVDVAQVPRDAFDPLAYEQSGALPAFLAKREVQLLRNPRLEIYYDAFNMQDPVLGQPAGEKGLAIRRAICLATDDQWAMERLYTRRSERVYGPILPEFAGYDPNFTNEWLRQEDEEREEALELARKTLADAGLAGGKGIPVLHMHILDHAMGLRTFDILKRQIAAIGIRVKPVPMAFKAMQEILRAKKAQMWTSSWYADYPDAQNFLQLFYGPNSPEPNYSNYASKAFDSLYEEARNLPPSEDPALIYEEMQALVVRDCPWRYRFRRIRWDARHAWIRGYRHNELIPKYFKYCAVDEATRRKTLDSWK